MVSACKFIKSVLYQLKVDRYQDDTYKVSINYSYYFGYTVIKSVILLIKSHYNYVTPLSRYIPRGLRGVRLHGVLLHFFYITERRVVYCNSGVTLIINLSIIVTLFTVNSTQYTNFTAVGK